MQSMFGGQKVKGQGHMTMAQRAEAYGARRRELSSNLHLYDECCS